MDDTLEPLLKELTRRVGKRKLRAHLKSILQDDNTKTLTIISNYALHPLRRVHQRGEVFVASEGSFDFSRPKAIQQQLEHVLERVLRKLKERAWQKVYLVPFGPAVLAMQIKLLVYRTLHIETVDVMHIGEERYTDIEIHQRELKGLVSTLKQDAARLHRLTTSKTKYMDDA